MHGYLLEHSIILLVGTVEEESIAVQNETNNVFWRKHECDSLKMSHQLPKMNHKMRPVLEVSRPVKVKGNKLQ